VAVTRTLLTSGDDTAANAVSISTASITPAANKPLLLTFFFNSGSAVTAPPTVTGNGLTWTLIGSSDTVTSTAPRVCAMYRAIGSAPTAGAVTITSGDGQTITGSFWSIVQFDGALTTGTNAADAFKNFASARPSANTSANTAFPGTITPGNATYSVVGIAAQELPNPGTGWSQDARFSHAAPTTGAIFQFAASGQQNITASWTTSVVSTVAGVEVVAAPQVSVAGTATVGEVASDVQVACAVPAGVTAGEVLFAAVTHSTPSVVPDQTGWTTISKNNSTTGNLGHAAYYRIATASEPASYTFTGLNNGTAGRATAQMVRLSGVDTSVLFDLAPETKYTSGTSVTTNAQTTVTSGALMIYTASRANAAIDMAAPSDVTLLANTTGTGRRAHLASFPVATPQIVAAKTWTAGTDTTGLAMITTTTTFRPAGAAAAGSLISLWTGVPTGTSVPITVKTSGAASVRLKIGTDSAVSTGVIYTAAATPDSGGYTTFTVTGLAAGVSYWYQAEVDSVLASNVGSFKTDTPKAQWSGRVAFASCLTNSNGNSTAFNNIMANAPEMFLHLGDFHYGDSVSTDPAAHRALYETQIAGNTGLKQTLRTVPTAYVESDHDSGSNDWTGGPGVQTPAWNTAIRQLMPSLETLPSGGAYRSVHRGRVKFILTDCRSFKSPKANADDANKTMFGATQEAWIAQELADPDYPVKVLAVDVPWVYPTTAGDDKWGGYKACAQRLVNSIASANAKVFMIHGDAHSLCADDGTSSNNTGGLPVAGAAPLGNSTSIKGGPYSAGTWPTSGNTGTVVNGQHGLLDITDTGTAITVRFSGRDETNTERVTLSKTYTVSAPTPPPASSAATLIPGTPTESAGSVTSLTATLPSGFVTGDYVMVIAGHVATAGGLTAPAGYSTLISATTVNGAASGHLAVYYKKWASGEANPTVTCVSGRMTVLPVRVSGADQTTFAEIAAQVTQAAASATAVDAPAITTTKATQVVNVFFGRITTGQYTWSPPAGTTELADTSSRDTTGSSNVAVELVTETVTPGTSSGVNTATASASLTGALGISFAITPAAPNPKIETLVDTFATADTTKWQGFDSFTTVTGGQLVQQVTSGYDAGLDTGSARYDLTGSAAHVRLVQRPNQGNNSTEAYFRLMADNANFIDWYISDTKLYASRVVGGTRTDVLSFTYSATTHQRLRIRESGGTIYWDTHDGTTWTQRASWVLSGFAVTAVNPTFLAGYWQTEPSPGTAIWDDFNIDPPPPSPKIATLTDDFSTGALDTTKWLLWTAGTASVSGGQLRVVSNTDWSGGIESVSRYDLTGSSFMVEVVSTSAASVYEDTYINILASTGNGVGIDIEMTNGSGGITLGSFVGGTYTARGTVTYDPVTMRWARLREASGTVYMDTAPDGKTWTQRASWVVSGVALTSVTASLGAGGDSNGASPAIFDNVNLVPTALNKLKLGDNIVGMRLGAATPSKVYLGTTQVWP